jgi:hypothetical protein
MVDNFAYAATGGFGRAMLPPEISREPSYFGSVLHTHRHQREFGCWRVRSGATKTQPEPPCSHAAPLLQITPFPQSWKYSGLRQVLRLEQIRPSAQRMLPHTGPVGGGPPMQPPPGAHWDPGAHVKPFGHSM